MDMFTVDAACVLSSVAIVFLLIPFWLLLARLVPLRQASCFLAYAPRQQIVKMCLVVE
jgi:hypothetical protein